MKEPKRKRDETTRFHQSKNETPQEGKNRKITPNSKQLR